MLGSMQVWGFPDGSAGKESAYNAGDTGNVDSIPGSGISPGEGNSNPLQSYCLENYMDRGVWQAAVHGVAKSWASFLPCLAALGSQFRWWHWGCGDSVRTAG